MRYLILIIPLLPLAGFAILAMVGKRLPRAVIAWIGAGTVGFSAAAAMVLTAWFIMISSAGAPCPQLAWDWLRIGGTNLRLSLCADQLSIIFVFIITFVGFIIHLYSTEFMHGDDGYSRFFAYMNLFVASMLLLVLAGDLFLLYIGWEGVGLCSYLLIGFWYEDPKTGLAARKAFIMTRVGDTAMAVGLFLLLNEFNTLEIRQIMDAAPGQWAQGSVLAVAAAALLLGGAVGKSAQLPLQTWLPDAMAGPSPVSALIHAATMVTAGVYLVARTHVIFELAPTVMQAMALIGTATLLLAGFSAIAQTNIKKVLAYSTISQIGYMFMALGVGAWSAAVFHFVTHAFFKALLFLGAGAVILALHEEHDLRRMGGLRKKLPLVFWTFLAGGASLSALPLVTAGFYSKELILWYSYAGGKGDPWFWIAGVIGSVITALYTFRMIILAFFGEPKSSVVRLPGWRIQLPLVLLAVLSISAGFIELPDIMGPVSLFTGFMSSLLPLPALTGVNRELELSLLIKAGIAPILGAAIAWLLYSAAPKVTSRFSESYLWSLPRRFLESGWGFDWLYDKIIVLPIVRFAQINSNDFFDLINRGIAGAHMRAWKFLSSTQSGRLRWYIIGLTIGAIIILGVAVFV